MNYGINNFLGKIKPKKSLEILDFAKKNGITYLDTAPTYGNAHEVIGDFHCKTNQGRFNIITKIPNDVKEVNLEDEIKKYLNILNIKKINTLLFHSTFKYSNFQNRDKILTAIKNKRLVKKFGVSIYNNSEVKSFIDNPLIEVVQLPFNLLDNYTQRIKVIELLKKRNKMIYSRSTFLQGIFFKKKLNLELEIEKKINSLRNIAKNNQLTIEQLAIQYSLFYKEIDKIILGVDSLDHLKNNLLSEKDKLDYDLVNKINEINIKNPEILNPSLW